MDLTANSLFKSYKQGDTTITAVSDVNIHFPAGIFAAVIGPSGCGKTTLLKLLAGIEVPSSGEIVTDGQKITDMSNRKRTLFRAKHFGFIFQNHGLVSCMTAAENIGMQSLLAGIPIDSDEINRIAEALQISHRLHHLPDEMSGGEAQRVAAARALIHKPQIVFADEPTGNLDSESADRLMELLRKAKQLEEQTLIMVTHNPDIAKQADVVYSMKDGVIKRV